MYGMYFRRFCKGCSRGDELNELLFVALVPFLRGLELEYVPDRFVFAGIPMKSAEKGMKTEAVSLQMIIKMKGL